MRELLKSIGPAIVVAAVVLGPGSILTSSQVGAGLGLLGVPVVMGAALLMMGTVALSARVGIVYQHSPCVEIANRLGRPAAVFVGVTLFLIVALFQSSNNIALVGGMNVVLGDLLEGTVAKCGLLLLANLSIIACLYMLRDLYRVVENLMKVLIGLVAVAFLINLVVVFTQPKPEFATAASDAAASTGSLLPLLGMIGTTFSVGGAFYQAYLVREKGWGLADTKKGLLDSIVSISALGLITCVILLTAWRVFYGSGAVKLESLADVSQLMVPIFGPAAKYIFGAGILAGALSSFMVNAMIGGTVMADSVGLGARMQDRGPLHFTTAALLTGMLVAMASILSEGSTVYLITIAQALTVVGIPALAAALIYLGTRGELSGDRKTPRLILAIAILGLLVSCILAGLTVKKVYEKLLPEEPVETAAVVEHHVLRLIHRQN